MINIAEDFYLLFFFKLIYAAMWLKTAKTSECDKIVICKEEKNIHFDFTQYIDYRLRLFFKCFLKDVYYVHQGCIW